MYSVVRRAALAEVYRVHCGSGTSGAGAGAGAGAASGTQ